MTDFIRVSLWFHSHYRTRGQDRNRTLLIITERFLQEELDFLTDYWLILRCFSVYTWTIHWLWLYSCPVTSQGLDKRLIACFEIGELITYEIGLYPACSTTPKKYRFRFCHSGLQAWKFPYFLIFTFKRFYILTPNWPKDHGFHTKDNCQKC